MVVLQNLTKRFYATLKKFYKELHAQSVDFQSCFLVVFTTNLERKLHTHEHYSMFNLTQCSVRLSCSVSLCRHGWFCTESPRGYGGLFFSLRSLTLKTIMLCSVAKNLHTLARNLPTGMKTCLLSTSSDDKPHRSVINFYPREKDINLKISIYKLKLKPYKNLIL